MGLLSLAFYNISFNAARGGKENKVTSFSCIIFFNKSWGIIIFTKKFITVETGMDSRIQSKMGTF